MSRHTIATVIRFELSDVRRSRWLLAYVACLGLITETLMRLNGADERAVLALVNVVLLLVPLAAAVFGSAHFYARRPFVELLLAQPISRAAAFIALYLGLTIPLAAGGALALGVPAIWHGAWRGATAVALGSLVLIVVVMTAVFVALAFAIAVWCDDRIRGLALTLAAWLILAVLYDGVILLMIATFPSHSLERPLLAAMMANPIDLARVILLLQFDVAAVLGYTGAVLRHMLGSSWGAIAAAGTLLLWLTIPPLLGARAFVRKDF